MSKNKSKKKKKIDYKNNLKEYFSLISNHKMLFWGMIIAVIFAEILFIADKFLYKKVIDHAESFIAETITRSAFVKVLLIILVVYFFIVVIRSFMKFLEMKLLLKLIPKIGFDLKKKYFKHLIGLDHSFHSTHKSGKLISRLGRGENGISGLTQIFVFDFAPLILQFILVATSFAIFSTGAAISLAVMAILFITYSVYLNRLQAKQKQNKNKQVDRERGFIADSLTNVESIKFFGKEKSIEKSFLKYVKKTLKAEQKYFSYFAKINLGQSLIIGLGLIGIIVFPIIDLLNGKIGIGSLAFIYSLFGNVAGNLYSFVLGIKAYYQSMTDMQDLLEYGKIQNEIKDKSNAKNIKIKKGSVEFKNVDFRYPEKDNKGKEVFKNFNLKIKPNEKIALVGHSGSGKTTIVKLLNRFYDVNSGEILIDGIKIKDVKQESLRNETGIVPQEAILFDDTIYNNLKFANSKASKEDIQRAIKLSQLDKIIKNFPKGMNTIVGERGVKLSGGEKQRVSIARAILANKKILVLDEATSALDSVTENEIQKALDKLLEGRTSIIIAHRLSTIMKADRIIVMKEGKIIEQGSHKELLKKKGEYNKLWNMQSGGYLQD